MSDPVVIRGHLDKQGQLLGEANTKVYHLQVAVDDLAERYEDTFNDLLVALLDEYESDETRRLPGEDVRNALVVKKFREQDPILFGEYRRKKAELDRGRAWCRNLEKSISSYQSQLKSLTVEMQAVGA